MDSQIDILRYQCGSGAARQGCESGPATLLESACFQSLSQCCVDFHSADPIDPIVTSNRVASVNQQVLALAKQVAESCKAKRRFLALGGDHSMAMGTWSGVLSALPDPDCFGLVWIDAHMDAHTLNSSHSGNPHGMPLAVLLGEQGEPFLNAALRRQQLNPANLVLIGVRSFEAEEAQLLQSHQVKVVGMEDVKSQGIESVVSDAIEYLQNNCDYYGISLDVDSFDPTYAPATGVLEVDGIEPKALIDALAACQRDDKFLGLEIAEYEPARDDKLKTQKILCELINAVLIGDKHAV